MGLGLPLLHKVPACYSGPELTPKEACPSTLAKAVGSSTRVTHVPHDTPSHLNPNPRNTATPALREPNPSLAVRLTVRQTAKGSQGVMGGNWSEEPTAFAKVEGAVF